MAEVHDPCTMCGKRKAVAKVTKKKDGKTIVERLCLQCFEKNYTLVVHPASSGDFWEYRNT